MGGGVLCSRVNNSALKPEWLLQWPFWHKVNHEYRKRTRCVYNYCHWNYTLLLHMIFLCICIYQATLFSQKPIIIFYYYSHTCLIFLKMVCLAIFYPSLIVLPNIFQLFYLKTIIWMLLGFFLKFNVILSIYSSKHCAPIHFALLIGSCVY